MRLRVLDLDGSLREQPALKEAIGEGSAQVIDFAAERDALRLWASRRRMRDFAGRIGALAAPAGKGPDVTFLGSGDFHHLTYALIARAPTPLTVLHFDNHPDWVRLPPAFHCGSWINRLLELPHVMRIVTVGPCGSDLDLPQLKGGNLGALADGRLELYPWRHGPSRVWGRIGSGAGHRREGDHLVWRCVGDDGWPAFLDDLVSRLPTDAVWITIDKDVLRPEDAATNWDQGEMPLAALVAALKTVAGAKRVAGIDVCGEYAPPAFVNPLKRIAARLDHLRAKGAEPDVARNARTNAILLTTLREVAA
ncbi:MAG TPA: hypothetical protein VEU47_07540 [Candidatus Cybelea sp.]|nr:hypothetical protein [Candidatus Cybelea sp.]